MMKEGIGVNIHAVTPNNPSVDVHALHPSQEYTPNDGEYTLADPRIVLLPFMHSG